MVGEGTGAAWLGDGASPSSDTPWVPRFEPYPWLTPGPATCRLTEENLQLHKDLAEAPHTSPSPSPETTVPNPNPNPPPEHLHTAP